MPDMEFPKAVIKSRTEQEVEAREGRPIPVILHELYHGERRLTQAEIATELDISRSTVVEWMQRYDIPTGYNKAEAVA